MMERLKAIKEKIRGDRRWLLLLLAINLCSISAIIRANIQYRDDAGRTFAGYTGWYKASRYLSDVVAVILNAGRRLADISPLTQLVAVLFMTAAGYLLISLFKKEEDIRFIQVIGVLPLMINPYFASCMSYKFDAPLMALSVLFGVLPFAVKDRTRMPFFISAFLCTLGMCLTYQASSGFFPILVTFYFVTRWTDGKCSFGRGLLWAMECGLDYLAAMVVYRLFIVHQIPDYSSAQVFALRDLPAGVWRNFEKFYYRVYRDYRRSWVLLTLAVFLCYLVAVLLGTVRNRALSFLVGLAASGAGAAFAFGAYLFMDGIDFRPRMMYGIGLLTAVLGTLITRERRKWSIPGKTVTVLLSWCFFVYFFVFGNAMYNQKEYTFYRVESVLSDLNGLDVMRNGQKKEIQLVGERIYAPAVVRLSASYPVAQREIPATMGEDMWGTYYFIRYLNIPDITKARSDLRKENLPVIKDTMFHTIAGDDTHLLITFK